MAKKERSELKSYFESGKRPKQSEFENLIDSNLNQIDDKASYTEIESGLDDEKFITSLGAKQSVLVHAPVKFVNNTFPDNDGNVIITDVEGTAGSITGSIAKNQVTGLESDLNGKQATLVSGTSIKTVNGNNILGSGNIQIIGTSLIGTISGNHSLNSSNTDQIAFPSTCDEFALSDNKTYIFKGKYLLGTGTTTHTTAIGWQVDSLNITSIEYTGKIFTCDINKIATNLSLINISSINVTVLNSTSTHETTTIEFEGIIRCTTGGRIKPLIKFSAAPTGTNVMKVGSFIQFTEIGSNTVVSVGAVS
jgi:hypothetical protein